MVLDKILSFVDFINGIFYGDYWFISWGIILVIFIFTYGKEVPKFIKSLKSRKNTTK